MTAAAERETVTAALASLLQRHCTPEDVAGAEGDMLADLWQALEQGGFTLVSVPEERGGSGGTVVQAGDVVRTAARFAAPLPLAETSLLAGWLLSRAGLDVPVGPLTAALVPAGQAGPRRVVLVQVPYGRCVGHVVLLVMNGSGPRVICQPLGDAEVRPSTNLAGEPRDTLVVTIDPRSGGRVPPEIDADAFVARAALARAAAICGGIDALLGLTVAHARQREQFGRPIARLQAVQQLLARLAGEAVAAGAALEGALVAVERAVQPSGSRATDALAAVAAAKIRCGRAAGVAAAIAHQVHGAIGITAEHPLGLHTRRVLAWRDEHGTENDWARRLGRLVLGRGPVPLWDWLAD